MTTSFIEEQRERLEILQNDLSVRRQQLEAKVPPPGQLSPVPEVFGSAAAPPDYASRLVLSSAEPSFSNKG
jgi:hypothetical protein